VRYVLYVNPPTPTPAHEPGDEGGLLMLMRLCKQPAQRAAPAARASLPVCSAENQSRMIAMNGIW